MKLCVRSVSSWRRPAGAAALAAGLALAACSQPTGGGGASIAATELKGGVYLFQGAGANVVALADGDKALVIDGGLDANSARLYAAIKKATGAKSIGVLINTHWHPEQVGLNDEAAADGATIIAHEMTARYEANRMTSPLYEGYIEPLPEASRPTEASRGGGKLTFAGHEIEYGYLPAAHTNGDYYVRFADLDILVAGGAVGSESWPLIDYWNGGMYTGLVRAHEDLAAMSDEGTIVVPAQGRTMTGPELAAQAAMYQQAFRDMNWLMNKGMGFNDVAQMEPVPDSAKAQLGDPSKFLDGAFRSLEMAYVPD